MLTVIIPTLNAAATLPATVACLAEWRRPMEVVVSDGGSTDGTDAVAEGLGAVVVDSRRGRGTQLIAGAAAAAGDWLLFLHADTRLAAGWAAAVDQFTADPANGERAAAFRFALDDDARAARRIERMVAWRCRVFALPYGDQGLLLSRAFHERLGGFRPLPLMEDVDMVRRIGRERLTMLEPTAITSAERYRRDGYLARPLRNALCLGLYRLGVPVRLIARIYR